MLSVLPFVRYMGSGVIKFNFLPYLRTEMTIILGFVPYMQHICWGAVVFIRLLNIFALLRCVGHYENDPFASVFFNLHVTS